MTDLFSRVDGGVIGDPGPLPFSARTPDGDLRTDLAGQLAEGFLTLAGLRDLGLWPVVETRPAFDAATQRLVEASRTKRSKDVKIVYAAEALPPPPPPSVPQTVSETQFMRAAVRMSLVTAAEAEGYLARGEIPAFVADPIELMPEPARSDARLKVIGSTDFHRADPTFAFLVAQGVTTHAALDALFTLADTLV